MSPPAMNAPPERDLTVIIPNLHARYSGVTTTNRMIAPRIAERLPAAWFGPDAPGGITRLSSADLLKLRLRRRGPLVWHARRNTEMVAGLTLKMLGWPLKLVFTWAGQRRQTQLTRWLVAQMDAVIATSEASAAYLQRPATVIPHGIDPQVYRPPPDRDAALAATGLPGRYAIGCFGRVRAQKGTDVFVDAMCRLLPRYPDFCAVVIGQTTLSEKRYEADLRRRAQAAGVSDRIRFLGELPAESVPGWYQRILVYAFTSRVEGFGLTLLEAMAAENAVVAARSGAAETVVIDGETGILVPPGDTDALAAALEPLMRDPERAVDMGRRGRARVIAAFSIDQEAERIAAIYRRLVALDHSRSPRLPE